MRTKSILAKCKKGQCPQDTTPPAKPHMALRLLSSISLSSTWVNAGLYYREMILLVNCFLVRDAVAFLPLHCFHFSVAPFSYGRDGVVLSPKFTALFAVPSIALARPIPALECCLSKAAVACEISFGFPLSKA